MNTNRKAGIKNNNTIMICEEFKFKMYKSCSASEAVDIAVLFEDNEIWMVWTVALRARGEDKVDI